MIDIKLDESVKSLNFGSEKDSETIHNALMSKGITTVEELCRLTKTQFSKAFGMDVDEIVMHLSKVGLRLGMGDDGFLHFLVDREKLLRANYALYEQEEDDDSADEEDDNDNPQEQDEQPDEAEEESVDEIKQKILKTVFSVMVRAVKEVKAKETRDQRIFEVAKEEFLRNRSMFTSVGERVRDAYVRATLFVNSQSLIQGIIEKEMEKEMEKLKQDKE